MRCLTLANFLRPDCTHICFVYRQLPAHLVDMLAANDIRGVQLPQDAQSAIDDLEHSAWLGVSQAQDAAETLDALGDTHWDWIVVDHYGIDQRWETAVRSNGSSILVIDDLADRTHDCAALIDQNLYRKQESRYTGLVPAHCKLFLGPPLCIFTGRVSCSPRQPQITGGTARIAARLFRRRGPREPHHARAAGHPE